MGSRLEKRGNKASGSYGSYRYDGLSVKRVPSTHQKDKMDPSLTLRMTRGKRVLRFECRVMREISWQSAVGREKFWVLSSEC